MLTILDGSTFCICDDRGDVGGETSGFFADDTRFLSRYCLTLDGERPLLLSSRKVEYFSAAFYLRNVPADGLPADALSIARERFVGTALEERVILENHTPQTVEVELVLEVAADFADIFTVKDRDFSFGTQKAELPPDAPARFDVDRTEIVFEDPAGTARTYVRLSPAGEFRDGRVRYAVRVGPRERWHLHVDVVPSLGGEAAPVREHHFGEEAERVRESLAAWQLRVPRLQAGWRPIAACFGQSVADLAALRIKHRGEAGGSLPAAGMPWFMTVFGRDTIITCLQTLIFGPELARTALQALAATQATDDDPAHDAEPGKIVHEVRHGKAARTWFDSYYGTVDATPLFLVLLSEVWRWTDDGELAESLRGPAMRALEWIDHWGDRDGDGFVEYERRSDRGLANQSWKDSGDSQRFHDGRTAEGAIAPCEVQGYVYDAKRRLAEIARAVWRDTPLAERLDREADELRGRFDAAYWVAERGGYYALALDGEKRRVDSLTSNIGHLLWSGIVRPARVDAIVDRLMGAELWSGWGVRTMASDSAAYNPLAYHNGTVWPHDNSLAAWGLARHGRWPEMHRIARRMLEAGMHFDCQLPEVFAGLPRAETKFPIAYPTAARPQAWAAGTPVLLLQLLLGLRPDVRRHCVETVAPPELPAWLGSLRLDGLRAFDKRWDVRLEGARVTVEEA